MPASLKVIFAPNIQRSEFPELDTDEIDYDASGSIELSKILCIISRIVSDGVPVACGTWY